MADFRSKKIRALFEPGSVLDAAGPEDLALVIALCRKMLRESMFRVDALASADDITLDPLPVKQPSPPKDGEAKD